ncbi:MAG TPA: 50S ribosomal protein L24 [Anaerolineae bacterium]
MDIKKGDKVIVLSGDDRGAEGEVQRVMRARWGKGRKAGQPNPNANRVVVAGVNLVKKHQRRTGNVNTQFGIIEREAPIHVSNVQLICPKCGKPTRVAHRVHADGTRSRVCKNCTELIDA